MSVNVEAQSSDSVLQSSGEERRKRLHDTIDALVALRQQVVSSYCKLAGVSSFAHRELETPKLDPSYLRNFCQVMVDYTAMGHFEVYQRIIEGKERRKAVNAVAEVVYPAIAETTDYLVDFNDKYDSFEGTAQDVSMLKDDISRLGEIIAIRGDLEDQLLSSLKK